MLIKVLEEYEIKAKQISYIISRFLSFVFTTIKLFINYIKYKQ